MKDRSWIARLQHRPAFQLHYLFLSSFSSLITISDKASFSRLTASLCSVTLLLEGEKKKNKIKLLTRSEELGELHDGDLGALRDY